MAAASAIWKRTVATSSALSAREIGTCASLMARATAAQGGPVPVDRTGAEGRARGPGPFGRWIDRWVGAGGLALAGAVGFAAGFAGILDAAPLPAGSLFPAQAVQQAVQAEDTANLSFLTDGAPGASVLLGASDGTSD